MQQKDDHAGDVPAWQKRMLPAFPPPQQLVVYDIRQTSADARLTLSALVGLIHRTQVSIYLIYKDDDLFWLQSCLQEIPHGQSNIVGDEVLSALLTTHRELVQGMIVYDPALPDTINVASMLASQKDALVVAPTQVQALQERYQLSVLVDLRDYQWRSRLQAYAWAYQHLLADASPQLVAGLNPTIVDYLRSYLIATRTFIYWLDARAYLPDLSVGLLSEQHLMQQILACFGGRAVHLGWFIDEGTGVNLTSRVAIPVLASDYCTNLEVWSAVQPLPQSIPATRSTMGMEAIKADKVYVSFTISDGDNLQYCQHRMVQLWREPLRGSFPLGWTISPVLREAAPALVSYYLKSMTANDELIAGPSGAGYMYPTSWPESQLTPFLQCTGQMMQAMHLSVLSVLDANVLQRIGIPFAFYLTGMNFAGNEQQRLYVHELYSYGLQGILSGSGVFYNRWHVEDRIPIYQNLGLAGSAAQIIQQVTRAAFLHRQRPLFLNVYLLAWDITLAEIKKAMGQLGSDYEFVLPGQLLSMLAGTMA